MVIDNEIKAKISPFAMREGEIKQAEGNNRYVSVNQIVNKENRGDIKDLEIEILKSVNKYEFMTSRQINQLLKLKDMELDTVKKINRKMSQMLNFKLLNRFGFATFANQASFKVYSLDKYGKYLLEAKGQEVRWKPTDNTKTIGMIKRRLAANQVIISMKTKTKHYLSDEAKYEIKQDIQKSIKTNGFVVLGTEKRKVNILLESIRREEGWQEYFAKRIQIYNKYLNEFKPVDNKIQTKPFLLVICEDKKHMAEAYKVMALNNLITDNKIYFTYDLKQNEESLKNSWYEFVEIDGKIKIQNLEIEVLG